MELVIKIPEETYEKAKKGAFNCTVINKAILDGVALPKGHGRLIDADAIEGHPRYDCEGFEVGEDFDRMDIDNAPTVIEADKES